jgi:ubiquinone/menaquinone biosynthesis C-methylase UbiE
MTTKTITPEKNLTTQLINGLLSIKPLAEFAKSQARKMIVKRANSIGVNWEENINALKDHDWQSELVKVENKNCTYPDYYLTSFHAYENGNLNWQAAWELESAAYSVHSTIYSKAPSADGDRTLRQSYHQVLQQEIVEQPQNILDIGCGVGLSTFALQKTYPESNISGLDLSPHFLAVANYQNQQKGNNINWIHAPAEETKLKPESYDLISAFLIFHELPQSAAKNILTEAYKLLNSGGYFAMMDMNPRSQVYQKMPRYVFTLLKSTEPYLDEYFSLDFESLLTNIGFETPKIIPTSIRHRAIVARKP